MSLIVDLIIILFAAGAIYLGVSRGFIRSVMHFASLALSILAVYLFTSPLSVWIGDNFIEGRITESIESAITSIISAGEEKLKLDMVISERPEALVKIAEQFSFDLDDIEKYYSDKLSSLSDSVAIENISEKVATPASEALSTIIAAVIVFAASMLALTLITYILDAIFRLPVLKKLNKFLGFLFGVGSAVVTVLIVANISTGLILALGSLNGDIFNRSVIDGSIILRFLQSYGMILFS